MAKALGMGAGDGRARPAKSRAGSGGYNPTRCMAEGCGATFTRQADENRHLAEHPGHGRYETIRDAGDA